MKNDYDDYDDYENAGSRWVSVMVLLLAVAGFMALAWYAYQTGSEQVKTAEDVIVIEADATPLKEKPADPGGMKFPHQEKTIYDAINSGEKTEEKEVAVVEKGSDADTEIKKAAEVPSVQEDSAKQPANETVTALMRDVAKSEVSSEAIAEDNEAAEAALRTKDEPVAETKEKAEKVKEEKVEDAKPKAAKVETPKASVATEPEKIALAPVKTPDPFAKVEAPIQPAEPAKAIVAETPKIVAPAAVPAPVAASGAQVQLGAFGSQAEAEQNWTKIRNAHSDVIGSMGHQIVRADLGAKGVYYRLRVSGFASANAAKQTCAALSARGQGCFLVQ